MVSHEDLIEVFEDTQKFYNENETLKKSITESINGTKIYLEGESPSVGEKNFPETKISVGKYRTFEKISQCENCGIKFCVGDKPGWRSRSREQGAGRIALPLLYSLSRFGDGRALEKILQLSPRK